MSNTQNKIEALKQRVRDLEQRLLRPDNNEVHSDYFAQTFGARFRVASSAYANAGESEVMYQVDHGNAPDIIDLRFEYLHRVPCLPRILFESLEK